MFWLNLFWFTSLICISTLFILPTETSTSTSFICKLLSNGGYIQRKVVVEKSDSPCIIKNDLILMDKYEMILKPGTELRFAPRVTLGINGTLTARGTPEERIKFTKEVGEEFEPEWPKTIRLVDDYSVHMGRLEILHGGSWRGVCANFENWTQADVDVACRQLGFKTGNFSFLSWTRNHTKYMLYHKPSCTGHENDVTGCPGSTNIKAGSKVCRNQQTIHLHCRGIPENSFVHNEYWSGIEFFNSTFYKYINEHFSINESTSVLENVDIFYAGSGKSGDPLPAVRGGPHVPHLKNVRILHSALDATNFTNVFSSTVVHNSTFRNNRGHGIVVESHMGHVKLTDNLVTGNHGNGVKVKFLDGRYVIFDKQLTFCEIPSLASQTYPRLIYGIPVYGTFCDKLFETRLGNRLTFNILEMDIEPGVSATLTIHDGWDNSYPVIGQYDIVNGTLPSGITSTYHVIYVMFKWLKPNRNPCLTLKTCVKFALLIDSAKESVPELYVNNTVVSNNLQHGIFVENVRNYIMINSSIITHNNFGAGLRVYGGAGDILINASTINHNMDNGVNITIDGGRRIINGSSFNHNFGNGVNITFNETSIDNKTRYASQQKTEVSRSTFLGNLGHGLSVGNYCRSAIHVINDSYFLDNHKNGIDYLSCYKIVPLANITNITIGYNVFRDNKDHAIRMSPLLNSIGRIANNTFSDHSRHVLLIDNSDDFRKKKFFQEIRVDYAVEGNRFERNKGLYVGYFRLTQGSIFQKMSVKFNEFIDNIVGSSMKGLNERSKSRAVVILSSDNIQFHRNQMENPESQYEISTHLSEMSATLNATEVWWGTTNYEEIIMRIFDQSTRYNLARIKYHPSLQYSWLYGPVLTDRSIELEVQFNRGDKLGGRLGEVFTTQPGKAYHVDRDIIVNGFGKLVVKPGTIFEFENSLGMLIQGQTEFDGTAENPISMRLKNESTFTNNSRIRLTDGWNELGGRLEVRLNETDEWSTVCNEGWTMMDASVACRMMGYVIHPEDWNPKVTRPGSWEMKILRSSVECTDMDDDLMECKAEKEGEHPCLHASDVYLKCHEPSWAGMTFVATAPSGRMKHVTITGAGLKDPSLPLYGPALRIDYNVHSLSHLIIADNSDDGLLIMKNDVYSDSKLEHSLINSNRGNGLVVKGSFFEADHCHFRSNRKTGFEYNPSLTAYEALQMRTMAHKYLPFDRSFSYQMKDYEVQWFLTVPMADSGSGVYDLEISVNTNFRVMVDILDYNPDTDQEKVTIYDGRQSQIRDGTKNWKIEEDLIDFPILSQLSYVTIRWAIKGLPSGRFSFVVRSKPWDWKYPFGRLVLRNSLIESNKHGLTTHLYSQPSDEYLTINHRHNWEKIVISRSKFVGNVYSSVQVPSHTKFNRLYLPSADELQTSLRIAEVSFDMDSCTFEDNGGGVVAEHGGIGFSNNVWVWQLENNTFVRNKGGGLFIEFPRVNLLFTELFNHSIDINSTRAQHNSDFEFHIGGFYCNASITGNAFYENKCRKGCIEFTGTEKDFDFRDNDIIGNTGKFIMEVHMTSHTPFTEWVESSISYNKFEGNRRPETDVTPNIFSNKPTCYALGIRGLQNITINRNIFNNPQLRHELLGGQSSSKLENYLDATDNWWGTTDQREIKKRIFDFDDWNSYAIAEYHPYLIASSFDAQRSIESKLRTVIDLTKPLGGRITENLKLSRRPEPYVVERDVTVMRGYSLVIEEGVHIQFGPGVGILVLGSLTAVGSAGNKIKFESIPKPMESQNLERIANPPSSYQFIHPDIDFTLGFQMRLRGGESEDGGFLEIFNRTEQRWSIVCDDAFSDRTAEVACKTMGKESSNVVVQRNKYYDMFVLGYPKMHEQVIEWFWRETMTCDGSESNLKECKHRINYDLPRCMLERNYVYVRCGKRNLAPSHDYWGNIRFSTPDYETDLSSGFSTLQHVDIYGAGILHDEKVATVQSVYQNPDTSHVQIHNAAWNGYDYIAPTDRFSIVDGSIRNINGYAVSTLVLNGQSSEGDSQFVPLVDSGVPHNLHGMLRMCTAEKLVHVRRRALIYHRYTFDTIDCVKIIRSREPHKQVAVRFLQLNLFNDSVYKNSIQIFNGEFFDPTQMIADLTHNSTTSELKKFYSTSKFFDTLGLRITASPAFGDYGFIAEVVTLPISPVSAPDHGHLRRQLISRNSMTDCQRGGVLYKNVGENNPRIVIEKNQIRQCGLKVLNNTAPGVIDMFIQNTRLATVSNNFISHNAGGITINTTTKDNDASLYANVTNNVIMRNTHCEPLHLEGHHFQFLHVQNNYIAYNDVEYRNIISAFGIRLNFTLNVVVGNTAQCILNASVLEKIDMYQQYHYNSIYNNHAFAYNRSTVFLKSAKFRFYHNFFLNPYNVFELVTFNRTKYPDGSYPKVQAMDNWWGKNHKSYVGGRIWDRKDDDNLIEVAFEPFITDNSTLLDGKCYPGWKQYSNKCYMYFGGATTQEEASKICRQNKGRLAWARDPTGREKYLGELVAKFQFNYDLGWKTWVYADWQNGGKCTALRDYKVEAEDCTAILPFICEKDPYIRPKMNWQPIIIAIALSSIIIVFVIFPLLLFCCIKSVLRREERSERKETLQKSLHASRQSLNSLGASRQSLDMINKSYNESYKPRPPRNFESTGSSSIFKKPFDSSSDTQFKVGYPVYADTESEWSDVSTEKTFKYYPYQSKLPPHVENEIPLLGYSGSESIQKDHLYDHIDSYDYDTTSAYSDFSAMKPKPKSRRTVNSSNESPNDSLIKMDLQDRSSDRVEFKSGRPKPNTKPKPPRPKLKPLE